MKLVIVALYATMACTSALNAEPTQLPVLGESPSGTAATVSPATVAQSTATDGSQTLPFTISTGVSYASGDFGTGRNASIIAVPLTLQAAVHGVRLTADIPYMSIRSRGTIFTGIDSTPIIVAGGGGPRTVTHSGLGDLTLGATYALPQLVVSQIQVEFSGRLKIPTASDHSGLSSGKVDGAAGIELTRAVGQIQPFISATYRILGDTSSYRLRNGFAASAGASLPIGPKVIALLSYHYSASASSFVRDGHELFAGVSVPVSESRLRLSAFVTKGLSSGAADAAGGLSIGLNL